MKAEHGYIHPSTPRTSGPPHHRGVVCGSGDRAHEERTRSADIAGTACTANTGGFANTAGTARTANAGGFAKSLVLGLIGGILLLFAAHPASAQWEEYLWEFPLVTGISSEADPLEAILQSEVQAILDAGRLRPLRTFNGDQFAASGYFLYWERGRLLTTLAWAYPHLTPAQQTAVRAYVAAEVADPAYAPWISSPRHVPPATGARREYYPASEVWNWNSFWELDGDSRPIVQALYGLWLWSYRTGDWTIVEENWTAIRSFYTANQGEANLYGMMCAHVAMVRMADFLDDAATLATATANANARFAAGLDFGFVDAQAASDYAGMYESRRASELYLGFPFLNLSPEIGRYLQAEVTAPVLARHAEGTARYPLWSLLHAPYFTYWTGGDEGNGLPVEIVGMIAPVERWVAGASATELSIALRSAPAGRGDCYWLEALVQAIEAHGTLSWVDVRETTGLPESGGQDAARLVLHSIDPSPTRGPAVIRFSAWGAFDAAEVRVFDTAGRLAAHTETQLSTAARTGVVTIPFPHRDPTGKELPSGVYHCRIDVGGESVSTRVVVIR